MKVSMVALFMLLVALLGWLNLQHALFKTSIRTFIIYYHQSLIFNMNVEDSNDINKINKYIYSTTFEILILVL